MPNYIEVDFLAVETKTSGDAIAVRYQIDGLTTIHVVDGGYASTGESMVEFLNNHYGRPQRIEHVVATHPDGDHARGLQSVLENFEIGTLWINRPWQYAGEIIHRFSRYTNVDNLTRDLKDAYPYLAALEKIAKDKGIPMRDAYQGQAIGAFTVMAPTRERFLDKIVDSEKTGEVAKVEATVAFAEALRSFAVRAAELLPAAWGIEYFPNEASSPENEMSIVQFARVCDQTFLLTADTGREGLQEVVNYAPFLGLALPGIDRFQVPHHGSRRNVSTDLLNAILGPKLSKLLGPDEPKLFTAIVSSAKEDPDHPRKAVVRAMMHRGAKYIETEGISLRVGAGDMPKRDGYSPIADLPYPTVQED